MKSVAAWWVNWWEWNVRLRLCAWGVRSCDQIGHTGGHVDASWLRVRWGGYWTGFPDEPVMLRPGVWAARPYAQVRSGGRGQCAHCTDVGCTSWICRALDLGPDDGFDEGRTA